MRVGDELLFAQLLERIRSGQGTEEDFAELQKHLIDSPQGWVPFNSNLVHLLALVFKIVVPQMLKLFVIDFGLM